MRIITKEQFAKICSDYKGVFHDYQGTHPEHKGRRTAFLPGEGTALFLEGVHFLVDGDYSHLPILCKSNAVAGACYQFAGSYLVVHEVYRLAEEYAEEHELMYLDRAKTSVGDFALIGSDVHHRKHSAQETGVVVPF